ncbi:MAG TPA: T9SS type A sorting domain-containing protein, partial [Balneolaceae bacterium]|nr:T9SS type A sorting domain-containing protein [Balneolaceae bacterium]
ELADALKLLREQWDAGTASWDAANPLTIWVADGTYLPLYDAAEGDYTLDGGRDNAFVMVEHVNILGGFSGDEDPQSFDLSTRDFEVNETILTGDLNGDDQVTNDDGNLTLANRSDNVAHVVIGAFDDAEAYVRLDGVTVMGGSADGSGEIYLVNGQQVSIDIGGGVYIERGNFYLANSIITQNSSSNVGGGIFGSNASLTLENTKVMQNRSSFGGGLSINNGSDAVLIGVVVASNEASASGGGLTVFNSDVQILNATFYGNRANEGGGIQVIESQSVDIANSIFRENDNSSDQNSSGSDIFNSEGTISVNYSLTQTWDTGTGNIVGADPQFSDPAESDYTLTNISPAINAGDPATDLSMFPGGPDNPVDLAGNPRVFAGEADIIDMGAYEFQGEPDVSVSIDGNGDHDELLPKRISLSQNFPNPFNPSTNIQFELPQTSQVVLEVYDMVGRRVATLVNEQVTTGSHTVTFDAGSLASGVYTYRLVAGGTTFTRQLTLIK